MGKLSGKVALITGGAQGIGRACTERFLEEGAKVCILDVDASRLEQAVKALSSAGSDRVVGVAGDISRREDVRRAVNQCVKRLGGLNILVANAGITGVQPILEMDDDHWQRVLSVNLTGTFYCIQEAGKEIARTGGGSIVVMASTNAFWMEPHMAAYNSSKGGVVALVRTAALDLAPMGIRINAVEPGVVKTQLAKFLIEDPVIYADYVKMVPMKRFAEPAEVASAVLFFASQESSYITGQTLILDGGLTLGLGSLTFSNPVAPES